MDEWCRLLVSSRRRVDKRVVSDIVLRWLVAEGYADVADCFEAEALLKADRPSAHIEERTAIRKLILSGDAAAAVSRCNALYPAMLDQPQHASLSFMAQQQTLIELIREQLIDKALAFARQEMAPRAQHQPQLMLELEKTMSLLAFPQPSTQSPYGTLLSQQRRHAVSSAFNAALLQQQQQSVQPLPAAFSPSTASPLSALQPAASELVRLVQRLHCLQPQLACTHSYPTVSVACKPSAAITASAGTTGGNAAAGLDSGSAVDGASSASQRSNSVVAASPSLSSALLSPVASRTPVTMPMPSRSVARHQLPSPFMLSSSAQPSVPPSPVSLSLSASPPGSSLSAAGLSPSFPPLSSSSSGSSPLSASSSRRSSLSTAVPFSLLSPAAAAAPSASSRVVSVTASLSFRGSSSGSSGSRGRGESSSSSSSSSASPTRRGQPQPPRAEDDDMT